MLTSAPNRSPSFERFIPAKYSETEWLAMIPEALELADPNSYLHTRWRFEVAKALTSELDPAKCGAISACVYGNVNDGYAGPESDIDMCVHVRGSAEQVDAVRQWADSRARMLERLVGEKTGQPVSDLVDLKIALDEHFGTGPESGTAWAIKFTSRNSRAVILPLHGQDIPKDCSARTYYLQHKLAPYNVTV